MVERTDGIFPEAPLYRFDPAESRIFVANLGLPADKVASLLGSSGVIAFQSLPETVVYIERLITRAGLTIVAPREN